MGDPQHLQSMRRPVLTRRRWEIMDALERDGGMSAADISRTLRISEQAVARHLDELCRDELIVVDPNHGLRRPHRWVITSKGRDLLDAAGP